MANENQIIETEQQDDKPSFFNMRRLFPDVDAVKAMDFGTYARLSRKVLKKELQQAPFFFHTEFEFMAGEIAPFLYIGQITPTWKKVIKSEYRLLKEFAAGICSFDEEKQVLELQVQMGKGQKNSNLKELQKKLMRKWKVDVVFTMGSSGQDGESEFEADDLGKEVAEQDKKIDKKINALQAIDLREEQFVAQSHTIAGVIRTELDNLKKIPRENADQIIEKGQLIYRLIQEWYAKFDKVQGEERKAEKQFIQSVEKVLKAQVINEKSLNALRVKEFLNEWKNCLRSKNQIALFIKEYIKADTEWDLDDAEEERDTMIQDLLDELDYLEQAILEWSKEEPQAYKQNEALLLDIRKKITELRQQILKQFASLPKIENPVSKEWEALKAKAKEYRQALTLLQQNQADGKSGNDLFVNLKKFTEELLYFGEFRKDYLETSSAKMMKKQHQEILNHILQQCNDLRNNNWIEAKVDVNDYRVLEFEQSFEQAKNVYDTLVKEANVGRNALDKVFQEDKNAAGSNSEELQAAQEKYNEALASFEEKLGLKVIQLTKQFDQLKTAIRLWMKKQQANKQLTSGDDQRIQSLRTSINNHYTKLETLLSLQMRQEMQDRQTLSPKALSELSSRTRLPDDIKEPAKFSKSYKDIYAKYNAYQTTDDEDLETKRYLLQSICSLISEWKQQHPDEKSKNSESVLRLYEVAYKYLEELSQFGENRNTYYEIIQRYDKIKPLLDQIEELNPTKTEQLQHEFIKIDDLIDEWHALNVQLSGFGNNQQSKRLAAIRSKIRSLAPSFLRQTAKQNLIADLGNRAIAGQKNVEDQVKAAALVCIEAASRDKNIPEDEQVQIAIEAGRKIASKQGLDAKAVKNAIEENWGDTAWLYTSLGNLDTLDELDDLAQNFNELNQEASQVGKVFRTRLPYYPEDDMVFKKLKNAIDFLIKLKTGNKYQGNKKSLLKNWEVFKQQSKYWEAIVQSYEENKDLLKNKDFLLQFNKLHRTEIQEKVQAIEGVRTAREGVKQAKNYHKNAQRTVSQIQADLAKLKQQKGENSEEYLALNEILTEHKMHLFNSLSNIQEQAKNYEESYLKLPKDLQNTKHKIKEKAELGLNGTVYQQATTELTKEFPPTKETTKEDLFTAIVEAYNRYQNSLKSKPLPSNEQRQTSLRELRKNINEWNQILIFTQDPTKKEALQSQASRMQDIQNALVFEADKLKFGDNDPIYQERPDALFQAIEQQYEQLNKLDKPQADQVLALKKMADTWAASHTRVSVQDQARFDNLANIQLKITTWLNNTNMQRQACMLLIEDHAQQLQERLTPYRSMPEMASHQDKIKAVQTELEEKIQALKAQDTIIEPQVIEKLLYKIKLWLADQESQWLQIQAESHRKHEQLTLAALDGLDVYADLSNIAIHPESRKAEILQAVQAAVERAMKMIEMECYDKAELMVAHIPVAFWPDELIEEMRLWKKIQDTFLNEPSEEMIETEFEDSTTAQLIADLNTFSVDLTDLYQGVDADLQDWGNALKDFKKDGKLTESQAKFAQALFQKMGIDAMDLSKPKDTSFTPYDTSSPGELVLDLVLKAKGIVSDIGETKDELVKVINEISEMPKYDITGKNNFKKVLLVSTLVNSTLTKLLGQADTFMNADSNAPEPYKIAASAIKGLKTILGLAEQLGNAVKERKAYNIQDFFKDQSVKDAAFTIIEAGITLGQTGASIASLFCEYGGAIGAGFEFIGDVKQIVKDILQLVKTCQDKNKTALVLNRAAQMDSVMLHPLRREMTVAKRNVKKASVDLAADSVKMLGSGLNFAGNIATLVPEGHTQAAGYGLRISGKIVQVLGKSIKIGGQIAFTLIEDSEKRKVKKLLELAKKDRNARMELLENSSLYAKMALVVGLLDQDPIAVEYCIARGLTEKDLDGATAYKILQRMTVLTNDNLDDKTSWEHVKDKVGGSLKSVTGHFKNVHQFVNQTKTIDASSPQTLKAAMSEVTAAMSSLKIHKYGSIVGGVILGLVTASFEGYDLVKSHLDSQMQECIQTLNDLKKKLGERKTAISAEIDEIIQQMQPLNTRIEQGEMSLSLTNQVLALDQQIQQKKAFLKALHDAQNTLEGFKQQFQ